MKKIKFLIFTMLMVVFISGCELPGSEPKDLYGQYILAKDNVNDTDSFSKSEDVDITFKTGENAVSGNVQTTLKFVNDEKDTWAVDFNIQDMGSIANAYYYDGKLYVDFSSIKACVSIPSILAKPNFLSMVNDNSKKNLMSSNSVDNADGSKTMTFSFTSDDTISNIKKLSSLGMSDIEIVSVTPSIVTVIADINVNGLLVSETSSFSTEVVVNISGEEHTATLVYNTSLKNYDINSTEITMPNTADYQLFELEEIKNSLTQLVNELTALQN